MLPTSMESLYRSWKTVLEMIDERGMSVIESVPDINIKSFSEFTSTVAIAILRNVSQSASVSDARKHMRVVFAKKKDLIINGDSNSIASEEMPTLSTLGKKSTVTIVIWKESLGSNEVKDTYVESRKFDASRVIIVYEKKITSYAANGIKSLNALGIKVEMFTELSLQINVTKHYLVPKHALCTAYEKREILEKYFPGCNKNELKTKIPIIFAKDPVAAFMGAPKGALIKITRPCESTPEAPDGTKLYEISYRIVV